MARFAALLAGLPETVGGVTVNRLCASGLSAIVGACHAVIAGDGDLFVAGGVESMTRAPLVTPKPETAFARGDRTLHDTTLGWRFVNPRYEALLLAGDDGRDGRERRRALERDAGGAGRVRLALAAALGGRRRRPAASPTSSCRRRPRARRASATRDDAREACVARGRRSAPDGTVTAGNSSGINDGAAALVIASEERARALGIEPLGVFAGSAAAGVDPR